MTRGSHTRGRGAGASLGRGSGGSSRGSGGSGPAADGGAARSSTRGAARGSPSVRAHDAASAASASNDTAAAPSRSPSPETSPRVGGIRGMVRIVDDRLVCDTDAKTTMVSSCMTKIFKFRLVKEGTEWKTIKQEDIDMYFEKFKKWYWWRENDTVIKKIWIRHAGRRYSDLLCNMKKAWKVGKPKPGEMGDEEWGIYRAYWNLEPTTRKSETMQTNRMSEIGGVGTGPMKHIGGSKSTRGHAKDLEKELGRPPTLYELMLKTHTRIDGSFTDEKSKHISEEMETRKRACEEKEEEMDVEKEFVDVVGLKKSRLFGTGSYGSSIASKSTTASSYSSLQENEELRTQVATLTTQLQSEREEREKFEREEQERRTKFEEDVNARFAQITEELRKRPPAS